MKKEEILALGVAEDVAQKVAEASERELKGYIPKVRFDEVNEAKKNAEALLKERDEQLENLKKTTGDSEAMKKQISDLQNANKAAADEFAAKIKQMQLDNAVEKAITERNGKNVTAIKALLNLQNTEVNEDGTVKGLSEQLEALSKAEDSSFLFGPKIPEVRGFTPAPGSDPTQVQTDVSKMNYSQLSAYLEANPDVKI